MRVYDIIDERECEAVAADSPAAITGRVEQSRLTEDEPPADAREAATVIRRAAVHAVKLVEEDAIRIDGRTEHQVSRLLLDLHVSVLLCLLVSVTEPDPENRLPRMLPRQIVIQIIRELQTSLHCVKLWVIVHVAGAVGADVGESLHVLVDLLHAEAEVEQVKADLALGKLNACVHEEAVC